MSVWCKLHQTEPLPVEDENREYVEGSFMEESSGDETLRHAVENVSNQLLRDIDLSGRS